MDRAIDSAAAKKSGVRGIHNRIDIELRDVALSDFDLAHDTLFQGHLVPGVLIETKNHHSNTPSPITPGLRCSWRQPLDQPTATRLASVTKAIVHAIRATLPEFDHIRFHSIAAPVRW